MVDHVAPGTALPAGGATVVLAVALPAAALAPVGHVVHRRPVEALQPALLGCWPARPRPRTDPAAGPAHRARPLRHPAALPTAVVLVGLGLLLTAADSPAVAVAASLPELAAVTVPHTAVITAQTAVRRRNPT